MIDFYSELENSIICPTISGIPKNHNNAIVLVAKCPKVGECKTRLSKDDRFAAELSRAMLSDVLDRVGRCPSFKKVLKILLYAPGGEEGEKVMGHIITSLKPENPCREEVFNSWILMDSAKDTNSTSLGDKLKSALYRVRQMLVRCRANPADFTEDGGVVFIGMDAPDIPLDEVFNGILYSSPPHNQAFLNPTMDGGYGMISIPPCAPMQIFDGVRWSDPLTAISQIKSLSDWNIPVVLGKMIHRVDEADDIDRICSLNSTDRHKVISPKQSGKDSLSRRSSPPTGTIGLFIANNRNEEACKWTLQALLKYGFIEENKDVNGESTFIRTTIKD